MQRRRLGRPDADARLPLAPLRAFHLVVQQGGFSRAAAVLGITQPAVTQQIQRLQAAVGQRLFHRDGRHLVLTEAGETLDHFAGRILHLADDARDALAGMAALRTGHLKLGASRTAGAYYVGDLLERFKIRHPRVTVSLSIGNSQTIQAGVVDFALHAGVVAGRPDDPELEALPFVRDRLLVVVPPRHALARRRVLSITALRGVPLVLRERGSATRALIERAFASGGLPVQPAMELESNEAIKSVVADGLGVAIMAQAAVAQDVAAGRLVARRLREALALEFALVYHRDRASSPLLASLLASLPPAVRRRERLGASGRSSARGREPQAPHGSRTARTI
jgi:DNA-binding transcriptional LysR family regulator